MCFLVAAAVANNHKERLTKKRLQLLLSVCVFGGSSCAVRHPAVRIHNPPFHECRAFVSHSPLYIYLYIYIFMIVIAFVAIITARVIIYIIS